MNRSITIRLIVPLMLIVFVSASVLALDYDTANYRKTMIQLLGATSDVSRGRESSLAVYDAIARSGDLLYIAPLIDVAYFARSATLNQRVIDALNELTGNDMDWKGYFDWAGRNDIALPPAYDEFKGHLLSTFVDPEFVRFFQPGISNNAKINLVEPVWGGVVVACNILCCS